MINPSIHGWVDKFFLQQESTNPTIINNANTFYEATRLSGFLVGYSTQLITHKTIQTQNWTSEEFSKVALLNTLFGVYQLIKNDINHENFIVQCVHFYNELHPKESSLLDKILPQDTFASKLEKIINSRIQTNDNIISKNFSHIVTNALLFIDVLAFKKYLLEDKIPDKYVKKIEEIIVSIVALALNTKTTKSKYDDLLQKLFESSVRYTKFHQDQSLTLEYIDLTSLKDDYEKYYIVDLTVMALWNDSKLEDSEKSFLDKLGSKLELPALFISKSIQDMDHFLKKNKHQIPYFNFSNPVKHFYDHTTQNVSNLITRNKSRLLLEISQSKELMVLLAKSTQKDLNPEEKKKVKKQLLDICKTIPSLTIFLVPGGSLLLPLLIKFIPQLLPSAFNENLNENE
jgi:hypothetical protein